MAKSKLNRQNYVVFVVAAMASFCFLLGSLLFLYEVRRQNEQRSFQYLLDATSQRGAALDQHIESDLQVLRGVAIGLAEIDLGDKEHLLMLLDGVNRSNSFVRMGLADTNGIVDLLDLDGTVYPNVDLSGMDFFQIALVGNEGVSRTFPSPTTELNVNFYTTPVYQDGNIVGVLCAVNTDDILWNILNVPVFQGQGLFLVTDSEGALVSPVLSGQEIHYEYDITQMMEFCSPENKNAWRQTMATGYPGHYITEMTGEGVIVTSQPLGYNGWYVLSIIPRAGIAAYYNRAVMGIAAIILAACSLFMLLLLWQMRMMNYHKKSLERLAYIDTLTGVSNQVKFLSDADRLLKEKDKKKYAVWSFDVKRFTNINDLFGVATGDRMLKWIASMLERLAPQDSAFCRFSADLFVGLRPYHEKQELHDWVLRLRAELAQQEIAPTSKMNIDSAMGFYCIADYHNEQPDITNMVNWASMARKKAKQLAGSEIQFFTEDMSERVRWEAELEAGARAALLRGDITFFLQPKVNIQDGCVISGAEALARWRHPAHGWISPAEFIPLFENNGFIIELDRYIFDQACKWYARECVQGTTTAFQLAINVSRQGLLRADFLEYYFGVKQHYGIANGVLELEITESTVLDDYDLFHSVVVELQKRGFMCSIDDFGSGYSSLNMLKNLTIDTLKLDAVFLQDSIDTKREQTVISHFIHMARNLGIKTVAEGVETSQQVLFLQRTGCDIVQGYYFSKPLPLVDFEQLMMETDGQLPPPAARQDSANKLPKAHSEAVDLKTTELKNK